MSSNNHTHNTSASSAGGIRRLVLHDRYGTDYEQAFEPSTHMASPPSDPSTALETRSSRQENHRENRRTQLEYLDEYGDWMEFPPGLLSRDPNDGLAHAPRYRVVSPHDAPSHMAPAAVRPTSPVRSHHDPVYPPRSATHRLYTIDEVRALNQPSLDEIERMMRGSPPDPLRPYRSSAETNSRATAPHQNIPPERPSSATQTNDADLNRYPGQKALDNLMAALQQNQRPPPPRTTAESPPSAFGSPSVRPLEELIMLLGEDSDGGIGTVQSSDRPPFSPPLTNWEATRRDLEVEVLARQVVLTQASNSAVNMRHSERPRADLVDSNPQASTIIDSCITHTWSTSSHNSDPNATITIHNDPFPATQIPLLRPEAIEQDKCCGICIEDYEAGDMMAVMPCNAMHRFHIRCIEPWLIQRGAMHGAKMSCPFCRTELQFGKVLQAVR
ncbi:uncharacterized protein AB675_3022 [Cyphellophora attinorum]|uniref:RING-type E3 ubiquitin transferase n=1 Tax=Cyphellophora attinorum TaxID=1664694 RepID=A0A0N0NKF5_9EURO|nr:uncharacterized protein AB675_3022 [Phialophora attinorum]KPI37978.1 hypothetical protein AB675_3022 [Phialophora attinorum]